MIRGLRCRLAAGHREGGTLLQRTGTVIVDCSGGPTEPGDRAAAAPGGDAGPLNPENSWLKYGNPFRLSTRGLPRFSRNPDGVDRRARGGLGAGVACSGHSAALRNARLRRRVFSMRVAAVTMAFCEVELESLSAIQKDMENHMLPTTVSQYVPVGDGAGELAIM